jgi:dihydroorotate dehydrogenase electron transfer subunit
MPITNKQQAAEFARHITHERVVLLADESRMESVILLAEALKHERDITPLLFIESASDFTQRLRPSTILIAGMPDGVIATLTVLDQQGIPARLCHPDLPGCHDGSAIELANAWLATLDEQTRARVAVITMGDD